MPWKPLDCHAFRFFRCWTYYRLRYFYSMIHAMPLPLPPTQLPTQKPNKKLNTKANNELAIKGMLCIMIGLGVVVAPYFIKSPGMQGIVAQSAVVGWFALALGVAFVGLYARRRFKN